MLPDGQGQMVSHDPSSWGQLRPPQPSPAGGRTFWKDTPTPSTVDNITTIIIL